MISLRQEASQYRRVWPGESPGLRGRRRRICRHAGVFNRWGNGMIRLLHKPLGTLGLLVIGITAPGASAWAEGPCQQIRAACEEAGFVQGAARDGIGLQMHCMMPIMQASAQPPSARRPLPKVDPQLAVDCKARNARFGPPMRPPADIAEEVPPAPASPSRPAAANDRSARGQVSATTSARSVEPAPRARAKTTASEKPAAGVPSQATAAATPPSQAPAAAVPASQATAAAVQPAQAPATKSASAVGETTAAIPTTPAPPAPPDIGEE
jgi:hypothetical protein